MKNKAHFMDRFVTMPVLAVVLSAMICIGGLWSVLKITVLQFPKIESSSLVVSTTYIGASADTVKGFVTEPIERVTATVPGIDYVESTTTAGVSTVTAYLNLNEDSSKALAELTARLGQVSYMLPSESEDPVVTVQRADRPHALFYLNIENEGVSLIQLTDYLSRQVTPVLNGIEGVQRVAIEGSRTPALRVDLDSAKLDAFGLSADEVYSALAANNTIATLGFTETSKQRIDLVANTQLKDLNEFKRMVIRQSNNETIYLRDVATVRLGSEQPTISARLSQQDTVYISVWPLPGANEIAIGDALYAMTDEINETLPDGIRINYAYDGTLYMRDALNEIFKTLVETVVLVGAVVLFMMGSFRSAAVPLVTIPISILGAVAAMYVVGFSMNLLTVLAIVLSVGLVVDDAIVVVENVSRYIREGKPKLQAALESSRQLFVPIVSMTLTLAMVYLPIGFLSGLTGILFKEFAFTLAIAVVISGFVAVTLSPIMSAYVTPPGGKETKLTRKVNGGFDWLRKKYKSVLSASLNWRNQILLGAMVLSLMVVPFFTGSKKELAPVEDQSQIYVLVQSPPESSLTYNEDNMHGVVDTLLEMPGTTQMWQNIFTNSAFGGVEFISASERDYTTMSLIPQVYGRLAQLPGINPLPILPSPLPTAGQFDVEMVVKSSASYEEMKQYADQLIGRAFGSGHFLYADTDLKIDLPQIEVTLKREQIADLGMDLAHVSRQLGILLSNNYVNRFDARGKAYQVIPVVDSQIKTDPSKLLSLQIKAHNGTMVPLSAIAEINWTTVPRQLSSFGQQNAFRIFGGVLPSSTKEAALTALEEAAKEVLPPSYMIDYAGESRQIRQQGNSLLGVMAVSLVIVYLLLSIQFNSFRDPLVVLLGSVPLAMMGALALSYFELTTMNIYSQIGLITLIGLIAKNGILIVEFANHLQEEGRSKLDAVVESAATRLRPILMTTAATVLGHFPLMLVTGAGAGARNSIGIILVAGMMVGTLFTLFVLPAFYVKLATRRKSRKAKARATAKATPALAMS
ncbi:efflux RND transporter permease subunit [Pseudoalteromonas ardens]|uniref:Acriflavine resistance protein B n=1 Tax=Pseudoalteromonas rubra TaxID=43658 RepID=A0A0L0EST3_9GAMM|nr:efflux RND transporter permease subunit [Pseudoalteromonas sp. R96]KNC67532.1 acriflavine resistance protein B [Pseudoalteromonas rubra]MDK1312782.1 efflux RND transporter permease subunit [Pseudoalteromonas sp. R96]